MADSLVDELVEDYNHGKQYSLNDYETNFIEELNTLLQFHIYKDRIISNYLTYIAVTRLGYTQHKEGTNLQYSIEAESKPFKIRIKEVQREA